MKRFFNHFKILFIVLVVVAVGSIVYHFVNAGSVCKVRNNDVWTGSQRVFDYADKLDDADEAALTEVIYGLEQQYYIDMAVVIIDEDLTPYVDARRDKLDYTVVPSEYVMVYADDFNYEHGLGWNGFNGDAIVFCDNWSREMDGNLYSWTSTGGRCKNGPSPDKCSEITGRDLLVLGDNSSSSEVLRAYTRVVTDLASEAAYVQPLAWYWSIVIGLVIAIIYIVINIRSKVGKVTTTNKTYVKEGSINYLVKTDTFSHKTVSKSARSQSSSSGGGGGHSSSGGGSFSGGGSHR